MKLYAYWRSSTSYRARIALNLKGLHYQVVPVNLLKSEQHSDNYAKVNPQQRVPALLDGAETIMQSLAIIEYLEEKYPTPPLLPDAPVERAWVRALALNIACDISPLGNLGATTYLVEKFGASEEQKTDWIRHWITEGFAGIEATLTRSGYSTTYCFTDKPGMADCCLIPQIYNAKRFGVDVGQYPTISKIAAACDKHPAFIAAHPAKQPDAVA